MLHFVLVEPAVPENVGAAARALNTMGFTSLWIVNSSAHREKGARILAHGSGHLLDQARDFESLDQVRREVDLLVGTSAKPRHHRDILLQPHELCQQIQVKEETLNDVALVFGREDSGLHSHEISQCDLLSSIVLAQPYPSLNLGQAVMLYAYALQQLPQPEVIKANEPGQFAALRDKCADLLHASGYDINEKLYQWLMERLPLLNKRDIGFAHHLVDKLTKKIH